MFNKVESCQVNPNQTRSSQTKPGQTASNQTEAAEAQSLTSIVEEIENEFDQDSVTVENIVKQFETSGFGPLLLVPALIVLSPVGGIPSVPTIGGIVIALIAGQIVFGRSHPWLPNFLKRQSFKKAKFDDHVDKIKSITTRVDQWLQPRYSWVFG